MKSISNNILAAIVAFYLSKFNDLALQRLGFKTYANAFNECAKLLNVKPNYIKLRRDEFDPVYNWRKGWRNRPMAKMVSNIITLFDNVSEPDMYAIIADILYHKDIKNFSQLLQFIEYSSKHDKRVYIPRAITGKLAEELFEKDFECNTDLPRGDLKDCRDNGCGYDYEIISADNQVSYVEVKGIAEDCGGVLFTNKEWDTAQNEGDRYYLCVVRNINEGEPTIQYIKNPAQVLAPSKHIQTIIQVSYSVTNKELVKLI